MKKTARQNQIVTSKPKKVTIKFFINKAVLPVVEERVKRYPLYMLITYDRKNTMMRSHYGQYYKDLNEIDKVHYPGLLTMEERILKRTIQYELLEKSTAFDLKGINKKYDRYAIGIHVILERYLKSQLWSTLARLEPYEYVKALRFDDPDVTFNTLYKIAKKIYKDLTSAQTKNFEQELEYYQTFFKIYQGSFFQYTFPTVIEWLDKSAVEDYHRKLEALELTASTIKKSIEFMDLIVRSTLDIDDL